MDEKLIHHRDLYLTTPLTIDRHPTVSAGERQQIYALDRAATGPADEELYTEICAYFVFDFFVRCNLTPVCKSSVFCNNIDTRSYLVFA
jgi:hypothetical protein